jgi:hypothetical protein
MIPTELIGSNNNATLDNIRKAIREELKENNNG